MIVPGCLHRQVVNNNMLASDLASLIEGMCLLQSGTHWRVQPRSKRPALLCLPWPLPHGQWGQTNHWCPTSWRKDPRSKSAHLRGQNMLCCLWDTSDLSAPIVHVE